MKMNRTKRGILLLAVLAGTLLLAALGLYLGRNGILKTMAAKRIRQLENTYGLRIRYTALQMKGLDEVVLQGLSVVPHKRDTLLTLQSLDVCVGFWSLLRGNVAVENVYLDGLGIVFCKHDSVANYDFLFRKRKSDTPDEPVETDYAQRVDKMLTLLYGFLPVNGELHRVCITERKDSNYVSVKVPSFVIKNNRFRSEISVREDTLTQYWVARGELNRSTSTLQTELYAKGSKKITLPYINRRFGATVTFDTLTYSMMQEGNEPLHLVGKARVSGLDVYHKALSPEVIHLDRGQVAYQVNVTPRSLELDSTTAVQFNRLAFHPYLRAEKLHQQWHFTASLRKPWFPADELFGSLPKGLFSNLDGILTSGSLAYTFLLDVDFAHLDSLKLVSELKEKDFRIVHYGATNLNKMSEEFSYTAYENGLPVRTFTVGPSWEHFTPLDSISPLLRMAVMQSEDGAFFYHHGFLPDAMREAIIHDLKVRRFARGGSTITMQLIKNVFLNRNKNFARKLEEALLVWLIETKHLTSKERMYEVYLNIAEWGPLVYGAQEAAAFYFDKRPSQLTAEESIFLASIIPKPKHFRRSFTDDMKLKENMEGYYHLIAKRLWKKGLMTEAEADSIRAKVEVMGKAREVFLPEDSSDVLPPSSTEPF
ncbi:MAG: biosynthetic peptidoglycan transglycosylase [Bacteroides sp.]